MAKEKKEGFSDTLVEERPPGVGKPGRYLVVLHNDDYTTMDFVIEVLLQFFNHDQEGAQRVMFRVHQEGKGVAGVYPFEIAETKVYQVREFAKAHGFPLRCTMEKE